MMEKPFFLSVKIFLRNGAGHYLILKRSAQSRNNPGKWDFPGGKVDPGETFQNALIREIREETGFEAVLDHFVNAYERELEDKKIVYLFMEGQITSGEMELSGEHGEYRFVKLEEMLEVGLVEHFIPVVQILLGTKDK